MKIGLIGIGSGVSTLTAEAISFLQTSNVACGATRMLKLCDTLIADGCERIAEYWPDRIADFLVERKRKEEHIQVSILYSGDVGFYSGAGSLLNVLESRHEQLDIVLYPGLSSVQLFSSKVKKPWQDWILASAHGRSCDYAGELRKGKDTFFLTGGVNGVKDISRIMKDAGLGGLRVWIGENLALPDERVSEMTVNEATETSFSGLSVMLVEGMDDPYPLMGIPDEAFIRGKVPMTKRDVRLAILSRMNIRPEMTVWDVGAGTGSVSVEAARLAAGGHVYAVEVKPEGCALIEENRKAFHLTNLNIVEGRAPEALEELPLPDVVFVGGSTGSLVDILRVCVERNPGVRIVVSAIVLETLEEAIHAFKDLGREPDVTQIQSSNAKKIAGKNMMLAENPVFIIYA